MHRRTFLATLLATPAAAQAAPLKVVATFSILADLVHQVGGPAVTIATLVGPGADAHVFQPRPSDLRTLGAADVLVQNGLGFEGWMDRMAQSAGFHGRRITAAAAVARRTFQEAGRTVTDPHAWQDPRNAALMVDAIAQGLAAAAPAEADAIRARAQAYQARIAEADTAIQRAFDAIPPPAARSSPPMMRSATTAPATASPSAPPRASAPTPSPRPGTSPASSPRSAATASAPSSSRR